MHLKLLILIRRMKNALEIANEACAISREDARHERIACKWFARFKTDRSNFADENLHDLKTADWRQ